MKLKISIIVLVSIILTSTMSIRFPLEPAIFYPSKTDCESRGIAPENCNDIEFTNFAWGDSAEYFKMAMSEESYAPYSLRPLYPKLIGFLAKIGLEEPVDKVYLFSRISKVNYIVNIFCVFLLAIIPFLSFYKYAKRDIGFFSLLVSLNVITFGVIQTSSFFMLDIVSYVIFSLASLAFFKKNIVLLSIISCIGILVKDISIVLFIPLCFLYLDKYKIKLSPQILFLLFPILVFIGLRYFMNEDLLSVQYGWSITKGEVKANYLKMHLGGVKNTMIFFQKVLVAIGGPLLIVLIIFNAYRKEKFLFLSILLLVGSVIFANIMLASRVPRVLGILIPFLVFYSLYTMDKMKDID